MTNEEENIYLKAMLENKRVYFAFKDKPEKWYMHPNPNYWNFDVFNYKIDETQPAYFTKEELETGLKMIIDVLGEPFENDKEEPL